MNEKREVKCEVLKVLSTKIVPESKFSKGGQTQIRIVSWNSYAPQLEKRDLFFKDGFDEPQLGKAKGFNALDFAFIMENADVIRQILGGTPAPKQMTIEDEIPF